MRLWVRDLSLLERRVTLDGRPVDRARIGGGAGLWITGREWTWPARFVRRSADQTGTRRAEAHGVFASPPVELPAVGVSLDLPLEPTTTLSGYLKPSCACAAGNRRVDPTA